MKSWRKRRIVQEIRECQSEWADDYLVPIRRGRLGQLTRILWDWPDWDVRDPMTRSWKEYRKTQYRVKSNKPKKDSSNFAKAMSKRDHFHREHRFCSGLHRRCKHCQKMGYWHNYDLQKRREWKAFVKADLETYFDFFSPAYLATISEKEKAIMLLHRANSFNWLGYSEEELIKHFGLEELSRR